MIDRWARSQWSDEGLHRMFNDEGIGLCPEAMLAAELGMHEDTIMKIRSAWTNPNTARAKEWVEFDLADRIISYIDIDLWGDDPELSAIYEGYDFSWLDLQRPTSEKADPLRLLDGISDRHAATILGVSRETINKMRSRRKAAALAA